MFMDEVVDKHMRQITSIVAKSFPYEEVEDMVQEVLCHMCDTDGPADAEKLAAWVGVTTRNHVVTLLRRREAEKNNTEYESYFTESYDEVSADPADLYERDRLKHKIADYISKLDDAHGAVMPVLYGEKTAVEVAEERGENVDAVRKRAQRLTQRLRSIRP